jgi:hypothetical protein
LSPEVKGAMIGAAATVIAAVIGAIALLYSRRGGTNTLPPASSQAGTPTLTDPSTGGEVSSTDETLKKRGHDPGLVVITVRGKPFSLGRFVRRVGAHWPAYLLLLALYNFVWETFGYVLKGEAVIITFIYVFTFYLYRLIHSKVNPSPVTAKLLRIAAKFLIVLLVVLGAPILWRSTLVAYRLSSSEGYFQFRVDSMLEHRYRLYKSPYSPEWLYGALKRVTNRPYHPELLDWTHRYNSIDVFMYHLDKVGVVCYEYSGSSYVDDSTDFFFVNYGEVDHVYPDKQIEFRSVPSDSPIPSKMYYMNNFKGSAVYGFLKIPSTFHFSHWFCAPGSMDDKYEGFVVDLRTFVHVPDSITMTFITDRAIFHKGIYRLVRQQSLADWVMAKPYYPQSGQAPETELDIIGNGAVADSIAAAMQFRGRWWKADGLWVSRLTLRMSGGPEIFLLRYKVR